MTDPSAARRVDSASSPQVGVAQAALLDSSCTLAGRPADAQLWRLLFRHVPIPVLVLDEKGHIVETNAAIEKHFPGYSSAQLAGRVFLEMIPLDAQPVMEKVWEQTVVHQSSCDIDTQLARDNGQTIQVHLSFVPLPEQKLVLVTIEPRPHTNPLDALDTLGEILCQNWAPDRLLNEALAQSLQALQVPAGAILLVEEKTQDLILSAQHGLKLNPRDQVLQETRIKAGQGLAGLVVRTGQIITTKNSAQDSRGIMPALVQQEMPSMALAPLQVHNRTVGVLCAMSPLSRPFGPQDQGLLLAISGRIGLALAHADLYAKIQRYIQEQSVLHEIAIATRGVLSLETVMEQGLRALTALLELEVSSIHFVDKQQRLIPLTTSGTSDTRWQKLQQNPPCLKNTLAGRYALKKRSLIIQDLKNFTAPMPERAYYAGLRTLAYVPLLVSGRLVGILVLGDPRPNALDAEDLPLLESLSAQLASAIETARLYEQTQRRIQNLSTLTQVSATLNKSLDIEEILYTVLDEMLKLVTRVPQNPQGAIFLVESDRQHLCLAASRGLPEWIQQAHHRGILQTYTPLAHDKTHAAQPPVMLTDITFEQIVTGPGLVELAPRPQATRTFFSQEHLVIIPLRVDKQPIGAILIAGRLSGTEVRRLLVGLGDMIAVAIEKARLYHETRARLDEITLLHKVSLAATSALDFDLIISRTIHAIQQMTKFEYIGVMLLDKDGQYLEIHPSFIAPDIQHLERKLRIGEGICGRVAETGEAIRVPDVSLIENFLDLIPGVQSELCVPLKVGEKVIGVIDVESSELETFSADDERLLTTIAGQLAIIMENARLHQETHRRLREMSTLFHFAQHLSSNLQMDILLDNIITAIREVLGCRGASIALLDAATQTLEIKAAAGLKPKWREQARLQVGEGIMGKVAATGQSIYVPDVHAMQGFIFFDRDFHSLLTVPLVTKDRVIGTLSIDHAQPNAFSNEDERLVTIAAVQAAVAIENARLFQDLQERAASLAQAYEELQEIDRIKDELMQNVSHELRTPLTFVRGYVDLMLEDTLGPLNEQQRQGLEIISQKTNEVTRLVSDIMLLQQFGHLTLKDEPIDLIKMSEAALDKADAKIDQANISLHLDVPPELPEISGDSDRLELVFENLLDNAIKFSPDGGEVRLGLEEASDHVLVSVNDQGIGIPKDQLEQVFERFYQVDGSATRRFEGVGLGLAIAKQIVQAHGGKIWVESQLGERSVFYFTLPKAHKA